MQCIFQSWYSQQFLTTLKCIGHIFLLRERLTSTFNKAMGFFFYRWCLRKMSVKLKCISIHYMIIVFFGKSCPWVEQFHVDELVPHQLLVDIRRIVLRSSNYECQSSWQIWVERKTKLHNFDALLDSRQILQTKILDDVFFCAKKPDAIFAKENWDSIRADFHSKNKM